MYLVLLSSHAQRGKFIATAWPKRICKSVLTALIAACKSEWKRSTEPRALCALIADVTIAEPLLISCARALCERADGRLWSVTILCAQSPPLLRTPAAHFTRELMGTCGGMTAAPLPNR